MMQLKYKQMSRIIHLYMYSLVCVGPGRKPELWFSHDTSQMFVSDEDECSRQFPPCEHQCRNLEGSYLCTCNPGYEPVVGNPDRCTGKYIFPLFIQVCADVTKQHFFRPQHIGARRN